MIRSFPFAIGGIPLRFPVATLLLLGCSASGTDPNPRGPSQGGTGPDAGGALNQGGSGLTGTVPIAGQPPTGVGGSTFGGNPSTGGATVAGRGGTASTGGTAGSATGGTTPIPTGGTGGAAAPTAGSTSIAGMPSTGGSAATGCAAAKGTADAPVIYTGAGTTCSNALTPPRVGYWYTYNDGTATQLPEKAATTMFGEKGGRGGADDCAIHTSGDEFTKWGGGVGFDVHSAAGMACPFDAGIFTGIRFYAKGTTTGTHGDMYAAAPNTIRVKIVTPAATGGDEFGAWCTLTTAWALCDVPFAMLKQEGFGTPATFDKTKITKIQFQAAKEGLEDEPPATSFDFWIDDVTFY